MVVHGPKSDIAKALNELTDATDLARGRIADVARQFSVKPNTLVSARRRLLRAIQNNAADERKLLKARLLIENRGSQTRRLFSDAVESQIIQSLRDSYPHGFTYSQIKKIIRENCRDTRTKPLLLSKCFIRHFMRRNNITAVKFNMRKRNLKVDTATMYEKDVTRAISFLDKLKIAGMTHHPSLIINVDETPSYVRNDPQKMLHYIDDGKPFAWTTASEKTKVSVIGACTGDGHVLTPGIIARGKTILCERRYQQEIGDRA